MRIYADIVLSGTNGRKLEMLFQLLVCFVMSIIKKKKIQKNGSKNEDLGKRKHKITGIHPIYNCVNIIVPFFTSVGCPKVLIQIATNKHKILSCETMIRHLTLAAFASVAIR